MGEEVFLQVTSEGMGGRERAQGGAEGKQAVRIDLLEPHVDLARGGFDHPGQEERGVAVRDDDTGTLGESDEQAASCTRARLDVGVVEDGAAQERARVLPHPVEDEAMQAVARPGIIAAQSLQDQERAIELERPEDRMIEGEVPARAAAGSHPVENEAAALPDRAVVCGAHPETGNPPQGTLISGSAVWDGAGSRSLWFQSASIRAPARTRAPVP